MEKVITLNLKDNILEHCADLLIEDYYKKNIPLSRVAVVFGGKRPALFLKKLLAEKIGRSYFPPAFFSIDEFMEHCLLKNTSFGKISDLEEAFLIYELMQKHWPKMLKGREQFIRFLPWAKEIISFIEQLDLEDIPQEALKNIQAKARLGYDVPQSINEMLIRIGALRDIFHRQLKQARSYNRGLIYLEVSRNLENNDYSEFEAIIFCGFFYLHKTESRLMRYFYEQNNGHFIFQGDPAEWSVLKKSAKDLGVEMIPGPQEENLPEVSIQAGFDTHSQACLAREILKNTKDLDNTAIVLPQPESLMPLLSEIGCLSKNFNVSMGYPLKNSIIYSLFKAIFKAQETRKDGLYYAEDYLKVLSHPLMKNLMITKDSSATRVMIHKIEEIILGIEEHPFNGSLFISLKEVEQSRELFDLGLITTKSMGLTQEYQDLQNIVRTLHQACFSSWENTANFHDFIKVLKEFTSVLLSKSNLGQYPLNVKAMEKVLAWQESFSNFSGLMQPMENEEIFGIFLDYLGAQVISFSGSPLEGLQVLGLLETRTLNFKRVIILDLNETALPSLMIYEPLIPREVMISLGLNRLEKEEEIQRYQFRRLIASAGETYLIYQKRDDKEKSRFLEELWWQQQKKSKNAQAPLVPRVSFRLNSVPKKGRVKKSSAIVNFLEDKTYSSSSLNTYIACPLRFYFQYVLGLKEKEVLLDEPEALDIGNFIHELLNEAFTKFIGKKPKFDSKNRKDFFALFEERFNSNFNVRKRSGAFMLKEVMEYRLSRFWNEEAARGVEEICALEEEFKGTLKLGKRSFKFHGFIDRIDCLNDGSIVILDYKTGNIDLKSFQLPLYLYFTGQRKDFLGKNLNAALYSLRDAKLSYIFEARDDFKKRQELLNHYLEEIRVIMEEIINPEVDFLADESNPRRCDNCPFANLCR